MERSDRKKVRKGKNRGIRWEGWEGKEERVFRYAWVKDLPKVGWEYRGDLFVGGCFDWRECLIERITNGNDKDK